MKNLLLVLSLLLASFGVSAEVVPVTQDSWVSQMSVRKDVILVDVRSEEEFGAGHIPGAVNIPYAQMNQRYAELLSYKEKTIVLYCHSGRRAGLVATLLGEKGFPKLYHLEGDMQGWEAAGRPVQK